MRIESINVVILNLPEIGKIVLNVIKTIKL